MTPPLNPTMNLMSLEERKSVVLLFRGYSAFNGIQMINRIEVKKNLYVIFCILYIYICLPDLLTVKQYDLL